MRSNTGFKAFNQNRIVLLNVFDRTPDFTATSPVHMQSLMLASARLNLCIEGFDIEKYPSQLVGDTEPRSYRSCVAQLMKGYSLHCTEHSLGGFFFVHGKSRKSLVGTATKNALYELDVFVGCADDSEKCSALLHLLALLNIDCGAVRRLCLLIPQGESGKNSRNGSDCLHPTSGFARSQSFFWILKYQSKGENHPHEHQYYKSRYCNARQSIEYGFQFSYPVCPGKLEIVA